MNEKKLKHQFLMSGTMIAGVSLLSNEVLRMMNTSISNTTIVTVAGASILGGILLDRTFKENEYEQLFRLCGLTNKDGQIPLIIKQDNKKIQVKTTLVIHLPAGISQKDFENKQLALEQNLNAKIEFGFNKNLIMDLIQMNLGTKYNYTFEERENPLEVYCGESYEGKFYLDIAKTPHVIVAGETGGGKSSLLNNMVLSLILSKHKLDLHLIDFQAVELGIFENCEKVLSYGETAEDFDNLLSEMEAENIKRLKLFRSVKNKIFINNLAKWNKRYPKRALPYKVVIVDEFSSISDDDYKELMQKFKQKSS